MLVLCGLCLVCKAARGSRWFVHINIRIKVDARVLVAHDHLVFTLFLYTLFLYILQYPGILISSLVVELALLYWLSDWAFVMKCQWKKM